jgi:hypothetical protein
MNAEDAESNEDRFLRYKMAERAAGREPAPWGDWLSAGQPAPDEGATAWVSA